MHRVRYRALVAIVLGATTATAQEPPAPGALSSGLRPAVSVRVRTADGDYLTGTYQRVRADTLLLRSAAGTFRPGPPARRIPLGDLDSLWIRGSAWKSGAKFGAATGAILYAAVGYAIREDDGAAAAAYMLPSTVGEGLVLGTAVGALWGGLIGSRFRHWRLHHPASDTRSTAVIRAHTRLARPHEIDTPPRLPPVPAAADAPRLRDDHSREHSEDVGRE